MLVQFLKQLWNTNPGSTSKDLFIIYSVCQGVEAGIDCLLVHVRVGQRYWLLGMWFYT